MLIICPSCASRYEIAEAKIGAGRKVRCPKCRATWQIEARAADEVLPSDLAAALPDLPPAPSPEQTAAELEDELRRAAEIEAVTPGSSDSADPAPEVAAPAPAPAQRKRRRAATPQPARTRRPAAAAGLVILAGIAVIGLGLWQRASVVTVMPQFASLYAAIGLPVNLRGLTFTGVESELVQEGQGRFLVVSGDVTNIARGPTPVPPITVVVKGEDGRILYSWTTEPPRPSLGPAEAMPFRARLASPPENGRSVQLRFGAPPQDGLGSLR